MIRSTCSIYPTCQNSNSFLHFKTKKSMSNLKLKMQCMFCHLQIKVTRWSSFDENFSIDCKGDGVVIATSHQDGGYEARTNKRENCVRPWCSRGGGGMCRETY